MKWLVSIEETTILFLLCCSFIIHFIHNVLTENFQQISFVIHYTNHIAIIGLVCNFDFPVDSIERFFSVVHYIYRVYSCNLGIGTRLRRLYLFSTSFFHLVKVEVASFCFLTMLVRYVDLLITLLPFFCFAICVLHESFFYSLELLLLRIF